MTFGTLDRVHKLSDHIPVTRHGLTEAAKRATPQVKDPLGEGLIGCNAAMEVLRVLRDCQLTFSAAVPTFWKEWVTEVAIKATPGAPNIDVVVLLVEIHNTGFTYRCHGKLLSLSRVAQSAIIESL